MRLRLFLGLLLALSLVVLGCSSSPATSTSGGDSGRGATYTVGGTVTGLAGLLVLQDNGGDNLALSKSGAFTFNTSVSAGDHYTVTVQTQPTNPSQICTVTNSSGTASAAVTNVSVACVTSHFKVGGTVTGLQGKGLVLQNNAGDDLTVAADGSFTFATPVDSGKAYRVTVKTQPSDPTQACQVSGATGTVGSGDVTGVVVNCAADAFTVGGQVTGLGTGPVVLQDNGGDTLSVSAAGTFVFPKTVASGAPYAVTVLTQPPGGAETCAVTNGSGTMGAANITNVAVTCTVNTYTVGGTVTGLQGQLVLQDNGGDSLAVSSNGSFVFATPVASGAIYNVTVSAQPTSPTQICSVSNGIGTVSGAAVTTVTVVCSTSAYTVGGSISGLADQVVLQDNGGDNLTISGDGTFSFATPVASGAQYSVTILAQPGQPAQTCSVANGTGTVGTASVTTVTVTCTTNTYTIGGNLSGLAAGDTVVIQDNGGDALSLGANGAFIFAAPVASGSAYSVTVLTQPGQPGQTCVVTAGTGTVTSAPITSVTVTCTTNPFTIAGTVTGLTSGESVVLVDNGTDALAVTANGSFVFPTAILSGNPYNVAVQTNPATPVAEACVVTNASGTVQLANVTSVVVTCQSTYQTAVTFNNTTTGPTGTLQTWTVPAVVTSVTIEAFGAQGGSGTGYGCNCSLAGGEGADIKGTFAVTPGEVLNILVGQAGGSSGGPHGNENGGGGGTYVVNAAGNIPLVIAGGGGGGPSTNYGLSCTRTATDASGQSGTSSLSSNCSATAAGATAGAGGNTAGSYEGGAGGGFLTNGANGGTHCSLAYGGLSYMNGGTGGAGNTCYSTNDFGGYGGGGGGMLGGPGGGGGYSGGSTSGQWSGSSTYGGGGSSYNAGTNQSNTPGIQSGMGRVIIRY